jgi:dynein heavy chain
MTTEPPRGLKPNLTRLYNKISEKQFERSVKPAKYKKMVFELCYFHATLLERKKFKNLGWNIPYDFNDSDFDICEDVLVIYIDNYDTTPWEAIRYLIGEANYGGRVTDQWDRRLVNTYLETWYNESIFETENFKMSSLPTYYIPDDGPLQSHKDYINQLPNFDMPEAFGQHGNADIASQIEDTTELLEAVLMMQPRVAGGSGISREDQVDNTAKELLDQIPEPLNLEETMKAKMDDQSALHVVLFQEVERYNIMLSGVRKQLKELRKAVKGFVVMTADLDETFVSLYDGRIPSSWLKGYPSLKPLAPWARDLVLRIKLFSDWKEDTYPVIYNMGYFTFPTGFLTAVLQTAARKNSVPIDALSWDFIVNTADLAEINQQPKEGVYIGGMFLEGAGWDNELTCLQEPNRMELNLVMPVINFKPSEAKKKSAKGVYPCPCYYYPLRTGSRERPSYMITVDLKSGKVEADHWIKRGTALLLSLAM